MKRFIIISILSVVAIFLPLYFYLSLANGNTDAYYLRFTTPSQTSMVIGTSRSAQGLNPDILNKKLHRTDIFNYSFTQTHSPFGPIYLNSIRKKLVEHAKNGNFIISVEPWALGEFNASPEDSTLFRENNSILDKTYWVSLHPNIPYLLKNYNKHFANLYADSRHTSDMKLHLNGWLEIKVNLSEDSISARTLRKVRDYAEFKAPNFRASNLRFQYLIKTIELLQKHGQVYLVRLPVGNEILTIENKIYPSFNEKIKKLSTQFHAPYIDFTSLNTHYVYVDGNHISTKSVTTISEQVSDSIMKYDELNKQQ